MATTERILFSPHLDIGREITLLRIENIHWPFGLLRYARSRREEECGLRIDFGKLDESGNVLILDHLDDQGEEEMLQNALPHLNLLVARSFSTSAPTRHK